MIIREYGKLTDVADTTKITRIHMKFNFNGNAICDNIPLIIRNFTVFILH